MYSSHTEMYMFYKVIPARNSNIEKNKKGKYEKFKRERKRKDELEGIHKNTNVPLILIVCDVIL